ELLPLSLTFFLLTPLAGRLLIRTGPGILIATGMSLTGTGIFALAGISSRSSDATMLAGLLAIGAGLGLITGPIMPVAVSNVPSERSGTVIRTGQCGADGGRNGGRGNPRFDLRRARRCRRPGRGGISHGHASRSGGRRIGRVRRRPDRAAVPDGPRLAKSA